MVLIEGHQRHLAGAGLKMLADMRVHMLRLQKNNLYAKAFLVIGHAYKRMGNYLKADEYQKKAVRLDPSLKQ